MTILGEKFKICAVGVIHEKGYAIFPTDLGNSPDVEGVSEIIAGESENNTKLLGDGKSGTEQ